MRATSATGTSRRRKVICRATWARPTLRRRRSRQGPWTMWPQVSSRARRDTTRSIPTHHLETTRTKSIATAPRAVSYSTHSQTQTTRPTALRSCVASPPRTRNVSARFISTENSSSKDIPCLHLSPMPTETGSTTWSSQSLPT